MDKVYEPCDRPDCPFASCMGAKLCMLPNIIERSPYMVQEHALRINCDKPRTALDTLGIAPKTYRPRVGMTIDECFAHIPDRQPLELMRYADQEVFRLWSYIFYKGSPQLQYGYCSHCYEEFVTSGLKHNQDTTCPKCKTACKAKSAGKGRKQLVDRAYITYYLKSAIDPSSIVAIGMYAVRDFSRDFLNVTTQFAEKSLYVFTPNKGGTGFARRANYWSAQQSMEIGHYQRQSKVHCQWLRDNIGHIPCYYSRESISSAIQGTPYQFSTWESYNHGDMVDFFDLYSRYPSVEYLTKLGFSNLVVQKLQSHCTYRAINWRGKSILKVLKLTKPELQAIRAQKLDMSFDTLNNLPQVKKLLPWLTPIEAVRLAKGFSWMPTELTRIQPVLESYGLSQKRLIRYLIEQVDQGKHYSSEQLAHYAWRDYIEDCRTLGYDLRRMRILLPKDLYTAHQETTKQITVTRDKKLDAKIKSLLRKLKRLAFSQNGYLIRPVESLEELINEGQTLQHCVGRYAERYASSQCIVMVVRKTEEPEAPLVTVEVREGKVMQCYGLKNTRPDPVVQRFVDTFAAKKLKRLKQTPIKEVAI